MKRFFPIILSLVLLCSLLFTGCKNTENTEVSTKDVLYSNYNFLAEKCTDTVTFAHFSDALSIWADENNIDITESSETFIALTKASSGELKDVESFTFHTALEFTNENDTENSLQTAATVMTLLNNSENHGNLTAVFTAIENGQYIGTNALTANHLSSDNIIDITHSKNTELFNTIAASSDMSAFKRLNITSPNYTKAYQINFTGIEHQSAYKNRGTYPNPIKSIGDLLASCQTSTVLFELASFEGGSSPGEIPSAVNATIVLHENDVEAFSKKFDNSYEKIEKMYGDISNEDITFEYTMTPVDLPSKVICKEDTENIVSLMYTMINGTYHRNENDEVDAFSNIGNISTENETFRLTINAKGLDNELMDELENTVETICGLSDINFKTLSASKIWTNPAESALVTNLSEITNTEPQSILEMKQMTSLLEKNPEINLICWGTNIDDADNDIDEIFEYIAIAGSDLLTE